MSFRIQTILHGLGLPNFPEQDTCCGYFIDAVSNVKYLIVETITIEGTYNKNNVHEVNLIYNLANCINLMQSFAHSVLLSGRLILCL